MGYPKETQRGRDARAGDATPAGTIRVRPFYGRDRAAVTQAGPNPADDLDGTRAA
jgi:hypothetical protein